MSVKMAGQTMTDRLLAARHSIAGQGLAKSVCKATTEELIGPKKKHLDCFLAMDMHLAPATFRFLRETSSGTRVIHRCSHHCSTRRLETRNVAGAKCIFMARKPKNLIHCTNEPNVSIPQLANLLVERSQNTNWVVVFKALITVHHMMCYGNERFTQYLASSNSTFQLSNFLDKSGVQAGARVGYDMSPFIRRYAKYLNEKAMSYRTVAFDFCKVKRGKEDGVLRTMNAEKLLKTLPALQAQLDALLEFDCTPTDLSNGVINMAFMLLFRDLIRLFAGYNDSIINLLEKYFDMNKKQCREALDLYKKFLIRMDRVGEFLKVAENVGIDKGEIPDLTKAPSSLLDALEQHLIALEGKKGSAANTPTQTASHRTDVKSGVSALNTTSSSFGTAAQQAEGVEETLRQQALAEEEAAINHYKAKVQSPTNAASSTNPFLISSSPTQPIVDLFAAPVAASDNQQSTKASDDLLQLGNPFADPVFGAPAPAPAAAPTTNAWMSNGFNNSTAPVTNAFVSDTAFTSVFGSNEPAANTAPAAGPGVPSSAPNPFMADFGPPSTAPESEAAPDQGANLFGGNQGGAVDLFELGEQEANQQPKGDTTSPLKMATPPPPRPPPPRTASPGMGKSAFDDLNDSIRMALGGSSPSRPPLPSQQQQQQNVPQQPPQQQPNPMAGFDPMSIGQPPLMASYASPVPPTTTVPMYGSPVKTGMAKPAAPMGSSKVLTGDLDSSLASLAENLTINKGAQPNKGVQWNSPKNTAKPGGPTGWSPQPMAATTGANYRPMGQGMTSSMQFPAVQTMGMGGMRMPQQGPGGVMGTPAPGMGSPRQMPPPGATPPPLDPFGAL